MTKRRKAVQRKTASAPRVYSYIRFSTPEQAFGDSERRQLDEVERFAKTKGMMLDSSLRMADRGLSGFHGEHRRRGALPQLRAVAANDPLSRIRKAAKEAIEKITAASPPQVQVRDLREELDKLREENQDLKKRLEKLESLREQAFGEDK